MKLIILTMMTNSKSISDDNTNSNSHNREYDKSNSDDDYNDDYNDINKIILLFIPLLQRPITIVIIWIENKHNKAFFTLNNDDKR